MLALATVGVCLLAVGAALARVDVRAPHQAPRRAHEHRLRHRRAHSCRLHSHRAARHGRRHVHACRSGRAGARPGATGRLIPLAPQRKHGNWTLTAPANLAAAPGDQQVALTWGASTDSLATVSGYYVYRNGSKVGSTTGTSYTDAGVRDGTSYSYYVVAYDTMGYVSSASNTTSATPLAPTPTIPSAPAGLSTSGVSSSGATLSWTPSTGGTGVSGYNVYLNGTIVGTTSQPSYSFTALACGTGYTVGVSAYDTAGNVSSTTSESLTTGQCAPTNTAPPSVSGSPAAGQTLTATSGTWTGSPSSYAYQWQDCTSSGCTNIGGASNSSYTLGSADVGDTVAVVVTATNGGGAVSAASAPTAVVAAGSTSSSPVNTSAPAITGQATEGDVLSALPGTWTGSPSGYAYQWQDCTGSGCTNINGATGASYALTAADVGDSVDVVVTATNASGSTGATSAQTSAVLLFNGDFQTGDLSQWSDLHDAELSCAPPGFSVVNSGAPAGDQHSAKVQVSDCSSTSSTGDASYLWEGGNYNLPWLSNGASTWFREQVLFPNNTTYPGTFTPSIPGSGWDDVEEWHSDPNGCGYSDSLSVYNDQTLGTHLEFIAVGGSYNGSGGQTFSYFSPSQPSPYTTNIPWQTNHWYDIVVHLVFGATAATGEVQVWVDGTRYISANVPTITTCTDGTVHPVSYQTGLYRGPQRTDVDTIYLAGLHVGPSAASVGLTP